MTQTGRILRLDQVRGYGFINPDKGNEDVFVHVNDLCDDKELFAAGAQVEFEVAEGDRGLKAFAVRLASPAPAGRAPAPQAAPAVQNAVQPAVVTDQDDDELEVLILTKAEFEREFTDLILERAGTLTGTQILQLRRLALEMAQRHGWVDE